jgi:hypothetical protein
MICSSAAISSMDAFSGNLWNASITACLSVMPNLYLFKHGKSSCGRGVFPNLHPSLSFVLAGRPC